MDQEGRVAQARKASLDATAWTTSDSLVTEIPEPERHQLVNGQRSGGGGLPPPPDSCFHYVASLGQGLVSNTCRKSLVRWTGANPVPG